MNSYGSRRTLQAAGREFEIFSLRKLDERRSGLAMACLRSLAGAHVTHDHLFHSVLGLLQVETAAYRRGLDAFAKCRGAELAQAAAAR